MAWSWWSRLGAHPGGVSLGTRVLLFPSWGLGQEITSVEKKQKKTKKTTREDGVVWVIEISISECISLEVFFFSEHLPGESDHRGAET